MSEEPTIMPGAQRAMPTGPDRPERILYVGASLPSLSETFVYREVLALRDRGVRVDVASVHAPGRGLQEPRLEELAAQGVPVYACGAGRLLLDALRMCMAAPRAGARVLALGARDAVAAGDVRAVSRPKVLWQALAGLALAWRVRGRGVRHIHAHMANTPASIAMYAAKALGVPFSFTGHANDLFVHRSLLAEKLRRASFIACISVWHREFYNTVHPLPAERTPVIRCGVDVPATVKVGPPADSGGGPLILGVGRLVPKKGFDLLLRAVAAVRGRGVDVRCRIAGDGPEREALAALARSLGISEHVELLGALPHPRVLGAMNEADLFVLPCRVDSRGDKDGIPVVLMEAMAREVCVVVGDLPAIRELVRNGRTGVCTPPEDVDALTAAISDLAHDPVNRARLARLGRRWVRREFSAEANVDRLVGRFGLEASAPGRAERPSPGEGTHAASNRADADGRVAGPGTHRLAASNGNGGLVL